MRVNPDRPVGNDLIESLPRAEKDHVIARCETVELAAGENLCKAGQSLEYVWFPLTGLLISRGLGNRSDDFVDMGLIGNEGMLDPTISLGVDTVPLRAAVCEAGTALRVTPADLRLAVSECGVLWQRINHYLYAVFAELAWTAYCNRFHEIGPRLARCLLLAAERTATNQLHLTHGTLAGMIGVRRSGVSIAARALSEQGLIRYTRGEIVILSRDGLKAAACNCYANWPSHRNCITPI